MISCTHIAEHGRVTGDSWTFLSNHAHALICLAQQPDARLRDLAERVGITERAIQSIVRDLETAGAITRIREGRRNRYELHPDAPLRHPVESHRTVGDLIRMVRADSKQIADEDPAGARSR